MTRFSSTSLKALLLIACSALYSGAASAVPAIWEAQLGATVTNAATFPALDDQNDLDTGTDLTFGTLSFPFAGTTYTDTDLLNISTNGFISLVATGSVPTSNGSDPAASATILTTDDYPRIAPFWTDLDLSQGGDVYINRFYLDAPVDRDNPAAPVDRIVITYAAGLNQCTTSDCSVLVQVQLLENGTIIFGYNGVDLVNPGDTNVSDLLIGISPAPGGVPPTSSNLSDLFPIFDSGTEQTIYELFDATPAVPGPPASPAFDLDDTNIIFTPNLTDGFAVTDSMLNPPVSTEPPTWESRIGTTIDGRALDNEDELSVNLSFDTMSFPFAGTTYTGTTSLDGTHILNISSNGFISLGGDNGPDSSPSAAILTGDVFPRIAPFWTDLDPEFEGGDIFINRFTDDDADAEIDRIVITFALGHFECNADECSVLAQVQLLEDGTIIFGYNGIDLVNALNNMTEDLLVGLSPGIGATDLGSVNIGDTAPFNNSAGDAVYELFEAASAPPFDLDGGNVVFTPDGGDGFDVTAPGVSGTGTGGAGAGVPGRNSNKHHCSLGGSDAAFDPTLWLLVLVSVIYLRQRRPRAE